MVRGGPYVDSDPSSFSRCGFMEMKMAVMVRIQAEFKRPSFLLNLLFIRTYSN